MAEEIRSLPVGAGLHDIPEEIIMASKKMVFDWKRIIFYRPGTCSFFSLFIS